MTPYPQSPHLVYNGHTAYVAYRWGGSGETMYVTGFAGVIVVLLAVLLMLGVVPASPIIIGAMFLLLVLGMAGPYVIKTV